MSLSATFLAALGIGITFLPQEILVLVGVQPVDTSVLLIQILGATYLGFSILNWMSRGTHIGGIYGRPVSMANFFHFAIGAVALVKTAIAQHFEIEVTILAAIYMSFGTWFGYVLFTHPATATPA